MSLVDELDGKGRCRHCYELVHADLVGRFPERYRWVHEDTLDEACVGVIAEPIVPGLYFTGEEEFD